MAHKIYARKRTVRLKDLKLSDVLERINPYVLRSAQIFTAQQIVEHLIYAYLSSEEVVVRKAKDFLEQYSRIVNLFTLEFVKAFCNPDGSIDWERLVIFNSGEKKKGS